MTLPTTYTRHIASLHIALSMGIAFASLLFHHAA